MTRPAIIAARRMTSLSTSSSKRMRTAPPDQFRHRHSCQTARPVGRPVTFDSYLQSAGSTRGEFVDGSRDHETSVVDDRHAVAELLHHVELVATQEDAATVSRLFDKDLADGVDAGRVEPGQWLVEHEELRVVAQGGGELHALLVAMGEHLDLRVAPVGDLESLQPRRRRQGGIASAEAMKSAEVLELAGRRACPGTAHAPQACTRNGVGRRARPGDPFHRTLPASRSVRPKMARMVVVLPAPFGPRNPTTWPAGTSNERSFKATMSPYERRRPWRTSTSLTPSPYERGSSRRPSRDRLRRHVGRFDTGRGAHTTYRSMYAGSSGRRFTS